MKRYTLLLPVVAAVVLTATGLGVGFFADDAYHLLIIEGERTPATDGSLYTFAAGDPAVAREFIANGPYPWWTSQNVKCRFMRPLSNAMHRIDYALFGRHAVFWHLHGMLWYLALVALWAMIARRVLSPPVAALAALVFAIDECHWMPAVWIANRNATIASVPVLFGLYAHLRWRREGWRPGLPLSVAGYAVGMLGGEAWLGIVAYVAAYELFGADGTVAKRALHLAPAALASIAYAIAYKALGYGVHGSGTYLEPLSALYLKEAPGRILALLGGLLLMSPVDAWAFLVEWRWALVLMGAAAAALFAVLLRNAWPAIGPADRAALRWLVPGAVFSLVPVAAAFPMGRLLLGPSIGASAVVAVLVRHWWVARQGKVPSMPRPTRAACACIAALNVIAAPLGWPLQSAVVMGVGMFADRAYANAPIDDTRVAGQDIFLLAAFDPLTLMYPPILRRLNGSPLPASWHGLSASPGVHRFTRTAANAFELEAVTGAIASGVFADILRGPDEPFAVGDIVDVRNARITVLALREGRPSTIRVECAHPLEDPSLLFLVWKDFTLAPFVLPGVGETRELHY